MRRGLAAMIVLACIAVAVTITPMHEHHTHREDTIRPAPSGSQAIRNDRPDEFGRVLSRLVTPEQPDAPRYTAGYRWREWDRIAKRLHRSATGVWTERGPFGFAGRARGLLVDPRDATGSTWWVASAGGGVWRTQDTGQTWQLLTEGLPTLAVQCLAMAPSNPDRVYAGTGESYLNVQALNGDGILVTDDGGVTWRQLTSTRADPRFENVARIVVSPEDPDVLLAATTTGRYRMSLQTQSHILRSTDGGTTWTSVHLETQGRRILQIVADPRDFAVQYAAVDAGGIRKSTDAGLTWVDASEGITDTRGRFELAISPVDPDLVFAAAEAGSASALWVSWNAGGSWHRAEPRDGGYHWMGVQGWFNSTIVCHPTDPRRVFVGGVELCEIRFDDVRTLACTVTPLASYGWPHPDHHGLAIVQPQGRDWFLLGTNDGGVMRTARGVEHFTMPIEGMNTTQFYGVDKRPGASAYVGGAQDHGSFLSTVEPRIAGDWKLVLGGDGFQAVWHAQDPRRILVSLYYNQFQRSLDGGNTWESATNGIEGTGSAWWAPFVSQLASSPARPDHVFAIDALGILRSTDFGGTWTRPSMEGDLLTDAFLPRVCVSDADPDVIWGGQYFQTGLAVSSDGGESFARASTYADRGRTVISGLATHPTDPDVAFALFSLAAGPKILCTADRGGSWTDLSGFGTSGTSATGFPDVAIYDLMVWPNDLQRIWVASEIGIVESLDGGASWVLYADALEGVGIWQIRVREDEVVVATHGRGIWTYTDPALEEDRTFTPLVEEFAQRPTGPLDVTINLRSVYDSTVVRLDGTAVARHGVNTRRQIVRLRLPPPARGIHTLTAESWIDDRTYTSPPASIDASVAPVPVFAYTTDFSASGDFFLRGCSIETVDGFDGPALHSPHPHPNNETAFAYFLRPIWVLEGTRVTYREILLVEPGEEGVGPGHPMFYDYFAVEATRNGSDWIAITPWRDARDDPEWLRVYELREPGRAELFRDRSIELREFFDRGDIVQIRFRFASDPGTVGWGWTIDDFAIVPGEGVDALHPPGVLRLAQNAPNPFNARTTIAFDVLRGGRASLAVYDVRGRRVRGLLDEIVEVGPRSITWDGTDDAGRAVASGVYAYELRWGEQRLARRMTVVR